MPWGPSSGNRVRCEPVPRSGSRHDGVFGHVRADRQMLHRLPARRLRCAVSEAAHRPGQAAAPAACGRRAPDRAEDREPALVGAHRDRGGAPRRHRASARVVYANTAVRRTYPAKEIEAAEPPPEPRPSPLSLRNLKDKKEDE